MAFANPWLLWLLPLALLPLLRPAQPALAYSSLALLPPDPLSAAVDWGLRLLTAACLVAIILGAAGLHRPQEQVERIGEGAQMVILLDSSGSMDRPFAKGNENRGRLPVWGTYDSKGQVARRLLSAFAEQRPQDLFAMFAFSRNPIAVLPLTQKQAVIQAAIEAGSHERGLDTTDLAAGLIRALQFFRDREFTGSRIVLLVSDGAAALTVPMQEQIEYLMKRYRVGLYWIYLRDKNAPGLFGEVSADRVADLAPEQVVHRFFLDTGLPYRAFAADDPQTLQAAIDAVSGLQSLPIRYEDVIPTRDLSPWCFAVALSTLLVIGLARAVELRAW